MEYQSDVIVDFHNKGNKIVMILAVCLIIGHCVMFIIKVHEHTDSIAFYHRSKNYTHYYPFIFLLRNLALMAAILLEQYLREISTHLCLSV